MRNIYVIIILSSMLMLISCGNRDATGVPVQQGGTGAGQGVTCPDPSYTAVSTAADFKEKLQTAENICLTANIELENWGSVLEYKGKLDGNDKRLTIKSFGTGAVGLIKKIAFGGEVKNLKIKLEVDLVMTTAYVGVLAGENQGIIDNVEVTVASGKKVEGARAGGLVGWNKSTIKNSYATGVVTSATTAGGLVGWNNGGSIIKSSSTGKVTANKYGGGLVGYNDSGGTIKESHATGAVSGENNVGGLVGFNTQSRGDKKPGKIENSYATGAVTGTGAAEAGGLVGVNSLNGKIENSYATGAVTANKPSSKAGGLVGDNYYSGKIENSYSTGNVTADGANSKKGSFIGANKATIKNSFVLDRAGLKAAGDGAGGVEALGTSAITKKKFIDAGWKFDGAEAVWKFISEGQWPTLLWQP